MDRLDADHSTSLPPNPFFLPPVSQGGPHTIRIERFCLHYSSTDCSHVSKAEKGKNPPPPDKVHADPSALYTPSTPDKRQQEKNVVTSRCGGDDHARKQASQKSPTYWTPSSEQPRLTTARVAALERQPLNQKHTDKAVSAHPRHSHN